MDKEEAAVIQEAAGRINAKIKAFKAEYKNQDDLNIAIMCCLDIMTEFLAQERKQDSQLQAVLHEISTLEEKLDHTLKLGDDQ